MMNAPLRLSLPIALVLLVSTAACGSSDETDGGTSGQDATMGSGDAATGDAGTRVDGGTGLDASMMGGDAGAADSGAATRMEIRDFTFTPSNLVVPAGGTVQVDNLDSAPHSVTSESTAGAFVFGAVSGVSFDTGPFMGTNFFSIPANAPVGTVVPCFCSVHLSAMRNTCQVTIGPAQ